MKSKFLTLAAVLGIALASASLPLMSAYADAAFNPGSAPSTVNANQ